MSKRQQFVDKAISYFGSNEADGSFKKIVDLYNTITPLPVSYKLKYTDEWCAGFVSAVAKACNMTDIVFPECGCERMIKLYQKAGRWQENDAYTPLPGDIIFYDWGDSGNGDNTGYSDHVGIVVSVSGTVLKIIEGNLSNAVAYRNLLVNAKYIRGYGLPNFGADNEAVQETAEVTQSAKQVQPKLYQLAVGSKGSQVKTLQILLIQKHGISCGTAGADGDFGSGTENAVITFQRRKGLEADGICGIDTWTALLAG